MYIRDYICMIFCLRLLTFNVVSKFSPEHSHLKRLLFRSCSRSSSFSSISSIFSEAIPTMSTQVLSIISGTFDLRSIPKSTEKLRKISKRLIKVPLSVFILSLFILISQSVRKQMARGSETDLFFNFSIMLLTVSSSKSNSGFALIASIVFIPRLTKSRMANCQKEVSLKKSLYIFLIFFQHAFRRSLSLFFSLQY